MSSCKRIISAEELLEPFMKRSRLMHDVCMSGPEEPTCGASSSDETAVAAACDTEVVAAAAAAMAEAERRKLLPSCGAQDDQPALKRLRGMFESTGSPAASPASDSTASREASNRHWAREVVKSLHGCPSVEQAAQRCASVLSEFETEVRQTALREAEQVRATTEEASQNQSRLQHTNKVLLRAVHHLAERCRRLEDGSREEEVQSLRQALEQAQDAQRRLQHSNEVLQEHIKIHLNSRCAGGF